MILRTSITQSNENKHFIFYRENLEEEKIKGSKSVQYNKFQGYEVVANGRKILFI